MSDTAQAIAREIFQRKNNSRREAAALPIEEKLRRLVAMQQRANEIRRSTGRLLMRVWELGGNQPSK
jgi:hypothetical protein